MNGSNTMLFVSGILTAANQRSRLNEMKWKAKPAASKEQGGPSRADVGPVFSRHRVVCGDGTEKPEPPSTP